MTQKCAIYQHIFKIPQKYPKKNYNFYRLPVDDFHVAVPAAVVFARFFGVHILVGEHSGRLRLPASVPKIK